MSRTSQFPNIVAAEFPTVTARNNYPVGLRKWGMIVTVYDDATASNNKAWMLKYNQSSTDKANNANWVDANVGTVSIASKTRRNSFFIGEHSAVESGSNSIIASTDLADGEAVTIVLHYAGKSDGANTGIGGIFTTTWTKEGGVLAKVADADIVKSNNIGVALTVSSSQASGVISIALALASGVAGNMSYSGWCEVIYRKAS